MLHNKLTKQKMYLLVVLYFALCELLAVLGGCLSTIISLSDHNTFTPERITQLLFSTLVEITFFALLLHFFVNKKTGKQLPILFAAYSLLNGLLSFFIELWRCVNDDNTHFSILFVVSIAINIIRGIFLAAFLELLISKNEKFSSYHNLAKKYWYFSLIVYIIVSVISQVIYQTAFNRPLSFGPIMSEIIAATPLALGSLFLCLYLKDYSDEEVTENSPTLDEKAYIRNMLSHVLLLLFTLGIYFWVWIYKTTEFTNGIPNTQYRRNPTTKMLLCMFVPFYYLYWLHYTCKEIEQYSKAKGVPCSISTLCVVLAIFTYFFVSPIIMQSKLNEAIQFAPAFPEEQPITAEETPLPKTPDSEKIDALKQYKELLDSGILTQEEFDTKKKQLLGL